MDFEEILRIVESSPLSEASKDALRVVVEKARPNGALTDEEKEQILAIFELEEKENQFMLEDAEADVESLETYLRDLDQAVEQALGELETIDEPDVKPKDE